MFDHRTAAGRGDEKTGAGPGGFAGIRSELIPMASAISSTGLRELLLAAGDAVEREESHLNALDSAIGDGDHGITMRLGFQAVKKAIEALPAESTPDQIFTGTGKAFMRSTGGAIGIILGRALGAAGEAMRGRSAMSAADWKLCFLAMEQTVSAVGKAKPDDKTMLDPLHAVNRALLATGDDLEIAELLLVAAEAAERSAEATASMHCRMGRASRLGDRALGHPDPGAVSFSIITRAMATRAGDLPRGAFVNSN
jgi:dihydroxyacetone kinase phosphoprotein-dependent L subunit